MKNILEIGENETLPFQGYLFIKLYISVFNCDKQFNHLRYQDDCKYNVQIPMSLIGKMIDNGAEMQVMERGFYNQAFRLRIKLTVSIALRAQSNPLLPDLVPARSMACSIFSVVSTPNSTGIPVWRETWAIPLETSLHT